MKRPHNPELRGHGLPWKSAVQREAQEICLQLHALQRGVRNIIRHVALSEFLAQGFRQYRQYLLFRANLIPATGPELEKISAMQAVKRVKLRQNHHLGKKSRQRKQIFIRFEYQCLRRSPDLR